MQRALDILLFQIGNRSAIERIVSSRWSILVGVLLVATTPLARNYDQVSLVHHGERLMGPFIAPLFSSFFIFMFAFPLLRLGRSEGAKSFGGQYWTFLGAFLFTAPLAWLYAIPVEQWMDPLAAAKCNVALLSLVSVWRVLLIVRVFQVVTKCGWWQCALVVLTPLSMEVCAAVAITSFLHIDLASSMGGISLESTAVDRYMQSVRENVFKVSGILTFVFWIGVSIVGAKAGAMKSQRGFPVETAKVPVVSLGLCGVLIAAWIILTMPVQKEQYRYGKLQNLIATSQYEEAFDFMEELGQDFFEASRPLPPDPWGHEAYWYLPIVMENLDQDRPQWIYDTYYSHILEFMSRIRWRRHYGISFIRDTLQQMGRLPGGAEFVREHQEVWLYILREESDERGREYLREELVPVLEELGIDTSDL